MRRLLTLVWLTAVWVTLWEALTWANVLSGALVAGAVVVLVPPRPTGQKSRLRPMATLLLVLVFVWELTKASALVAWEVITPRIRIEPAVVSVRLTSDVAGVITAVANMVSLTPGTITLDVDEGTRTLFIHVLHLRSIEATRGSVQRLERLVLDAFSLRAPAPANREDPPT